jgi:trypsin-like peptidase/effector-associated domain 1 (EAD1)-containing protein
MELTPQQVEDLRLAIMAAYPGVGGVDDLNMALNTVGIDLAWRASLFGNPEKAVHNVIIRENARGKIADVIGAARRGNSTNARLAELETKWLKTSSATDRVRLEAMVVAELRPAEAGDWSNRLNAAYRWVCRVEKQADGASIGTGFLVADDLVLTNYHVMYGTQSPGSAQPAQVQLRFDALDGVAARIATLAAGGPLAKSTPGDNEWGAGGNDPTFDQLDFALLKLSEPVGRDDTGGKQRGHVLIESADIAGEAKRPVIVLQHPLGANLQICLGAFDEPNANGTRLHHTATTQRGSSGSPCLSMDLKVVGLHNGGTGGRNTAIPLSVIASVVNRNGPIIPVQAP